MGITGQSKKIMKAAIYSPYLDTLGGGERYMISAAKVLSENGYTVDIQSTDDQILKKLEKKFGLSFKNIRITQNIKRGDGYDVCLWLSDGSVPFLFSRTNILHFQRPFTKVDGKSLLNRTKFFRIKNIIVNSEFTKNWIDKEYPKESKVIYPPVDVKKFKSEKKQNIILYVGRFSQLEQLKRQDVLVECFRKMCDIGYKEWKLVITGGNEIGRTKYVDDLKESAKGYPIYIIENPPFTDLKEMYGTAKIFWSAAGFGVDEDKEPQKLEHFGMTVVEAMSAGCVPIIYKGGGHTEIIRDDSNGKLWKRKDELIQSTILLMNDQKKIKDLSAQAKIDAQQYSYEQFEEKILQLLS